METNNIFNEKIFNFEDRLVRFAQGTISDKDFVFKVGLSVKELKESRNSLKILNYIKEGEEITRTLLLKEVEELIAIASKMIINKK